MWWKKNKRRVLITVLAAAVLAAAFYFGGGSPGSRGWSVPGNESLEPPGPLASIAADTPAGQTAAPASGPAKTTEPPPVPAAAPSPSPAAKTEPSAVPAGSPAPASPENTAAPEAHTCTISISCASLLNNMDALDEAKAELVPDDGWILSPEKVDFYEGESVFNVLQRTCKQHGIHMEYMNTPIYDSAYIEGIGNLYELDAGGLSGWMYKVNGRFPNYGCSRCPLQDGDVVCWVYTCDLGRDVGGEYSSGGQKDE